MSVTTAKMPPLGAPPRLPARWAWIMERSAGIGIIVGWTHTPALGIIAGFVTLAALHVIME